MPTHATRPSIENAYRLVVLDQLCVKSSHQTCATKVSTPGFNIRSRRDMNWIIAKRRGMKYKHYSH